MKMMKMMMIIYYFAYTLLTFGTLTRSPTFDEYRLYLQKMASSMVSQMQGYYANWCPKQRATCPVKSYNGCKGAKIKYCDTQFPTSTQCLTEGQFASMASTIKFPPHIDYTTLSEEDMRFVCTSAKMEGTFAKLASVRNKKFTFMYFGSKNGLFRRFPGEYRGVTWGKCDVYDPRIRPWYTIASSGAKNIILLIDVSSSMMAFQSQVIIAASALIKTLSLSDKMAVISFGEGVSILGQSQIQMVAATDTAKTAFISAISALSFNFDQQTDYKNAFMAGLKLANYTISQGGVGCSQTQIIFYVITDGGDTSSNYSSTVLIQKMDNFTKSNSSWLKKTTVFAYILGQFTNENIDHLRNITCHFGGMILSSSKTLTSVSLAITKLQDFYSYFAISPLMTNSSAIWTEPYYDFYSGVEVMTLSLPFFYTDPQTNITSLVGVLGIDILVSDFMKYGYDLQQVQLKLISERTCQLSEQSNECEVQFLRKSEYKCHHLSDKCNYSIVASTCSNIPSTLDVYTTENTQINIKRCCGLAKSQFVFIVGGSIILIFLSFLAIWKRDKIIMRVCGNRYRLLGNAKVGGKGSKDSIVGGRKTHRKVSLKNVEPPLSTKIQSLSRIQSSESKEQLHYDNFYIEDKEQFM